MIHSLKLINRQQGAALLLFILIIMISMAGFYASLIDPEELRIRRQAHTIKSLMIAKEALIAHVVSHYEWKPNDSALSDPPSYEFIRLPCPDFSAAGYEGAQEGNCGSVNLKNRLGRFPWRSLELDTLRDGSGECLWYAVSGNFKNSNIKSAINSDSKGRIDIYDKEGETLLYGGSAETRVVAAIIAPGAALTTQNRQESSDLPICGGNYTASNYLESAGGIDNAAFEGLNADISRLVHFGHGSSNNDIVMPVTRDELLKAVYTRGDIVKKIEALTKKIAECISEFGKNNAAYPADKRLPYAAPIALPDYNDNDLYDDEDWQLTGRIPYKVDTSKSKVNSAAQSVFFDSCSNELSIESSESRKLFHHWKEQFFYAVSQDRSPDSTATSPSCTMGSCVTVNGKEYAAIIFYSGSSLASQTRNAPPDIAQGLDTKSVIANYLEDENVNRFIENTGSGIYQANQPVTESFNDLAYCIDSENLAVTVCT